MTNLAIEYSLTRICEFARRLHQLQRVGDDEAIEREFNAVCRVIWGYTLDDFTDDDLSVEDHLWLDGLTRECALDFAAQQATLKDYIHGGFIVSTCLASARIIHVKPHQSAPETRAATWCRHGEKTWWA